jgi:aminoglycoside 3'-phosphotransferase-1
MSERREETTTEPVLTRALAARLTGRCWARNIVGEAGASVYRIHGNGAPESYLKHGEGEAAAAVEDEVRRLRWASSAGWPVPQVEHFERSAGQAWLLTSAVPGLTAGEWLTRRPDQAGRIAMALGSALSQLHAVPVGLCPFGADHHQRLSEARRRLDAGVIDESDFDEARRGWSAHAVWREMQRMLPLDVDPVVCHGDYSLDNILLGDGLRVTGVIDLARLGVSDRYQDLAVMWNGLEELGHEVQRQFMGGYGIELPDERKLHFFLCLDECF